MPDIDVGDIEDPWERGKAKARAAIEMAVEDINDEIMEHMNERPFEIAPDGHPHIFHLNAAQDQKRRMREALRDGTDR